MAEGVATVRIVASTTGAFAECPSFDGVLLHGVGCAGVCFPDVDLSSLGQVRNHRRVRESSGSILDRILEGVGASNAMFPGASIDISLPQLSISA